MVNDFLPAAVPNWINGRERQAISGETFEKLNPANGRLLCQAAHSREADIQEAVASALKAQPAWAYTPPVKRGLLLHDVVLGMKACRNEISAVVAAETGKSLKDIYTSINPGSL